MCRLRGCVFCFVIKVVLDSRVYDFGLFKVVYVPWAVRLMSEAGRLEKPACHV